MPTTTLLPLQERIRTTAEVFMPERLRSMTTFESENIAILGSEVIRARRLCVEATAALRLAESLAQMAREALANGTLEREPTQAELCEAKEILGEFRRLAQTARERLSRAEQAFDEALLGGLANLHVALLN
jgi:hypothetical protein